LYFVKIIPKTGDNWKPDMNITTVAGSGIISPPPEFL